MRIPSGVTDQYIYFVAVDSADLKTRETGLSTFTVYRSRNGGTATAMTTPTVAELSAANMPGVYSLLLDEDMTIGSGNDSEEMVFHITQASMAPVTRTIELYRPKITAGNTLGVAADGDVSGNVDGAVASVTAGVSLAAGAITDASLAGNMEIVFETDFATNYNQTRNAWATNAQDFVGTTASDPFNGQVVAASVTGAVGSITNLTIAASTTLATGTHNPQSGDSYARLGAPAGASIAADIATVDTVADNLNLGIIYGTAQTGTLSTTQMTTDLTGYADDELIGRVVVWTGGTANGQASEITDYANASGLVTYNTITTAPVNGDTFKIV